MEALSMRGFPGIRFRPHPPSTGSPPSTRLPPPPPRCSQCFRTIPPCTKAAFSHVGGGGSSSTAPTPAVLGRCRHSSFHGRHICKRSQVRVTRHGEALLVCGRLKCLWHCCRVAVCGCSRVVLRWAMFFHITFFLFVCQ